MSHHPVLDALVGALGAGRVRASAHGVDPDERTGQHVSARPLGVPLCWVAPGDAAACAEVARIAHEHGVAVRVVSEATTYWGGPSVQGAVVIDGFALREPFVIDEARRCALVGAGVSVRELDREARRRGLCLLSYPDTNGGTRLGAMLSIGSAAGLGMGHGVPIDAVTSATLVTPRGRVVRCGASHALGAPPFAKGGLPSALSAVEGAQGEGAIVAEVGLALAPAPYLAHARASTPLPDVATMLRALGAARAALDERTLDSFTLEVVAEGGRAPRAEIFARSFSLRSSADAEASLRALLDRLGAAQARVIVESDEGRRGVEPAYGARFRGPAEAHRAGLAAGSFWGTDVLVSWGPELEHTLTALLGLFGQIGALPLLMRRLGVYPGHHTISIGVQALGGRGAPDVDELVARLGTPLDELLALGAVPYRPGVLWQGALERSAAFREHVRAPHVALSSALALLPGAR